MNGRLLLLGIVIVVSTLPTSGCAPSAAALPADVPAEVPVGSTPPASPTVAPAPRPTTPVGVPFPVYTRNVALAYLAARYGDLAPAADLEWVAENTTDDPSGTDSTFRYTAGDWTITLYPIIPPGQTIYTVVATNVATGFTWEGQIGLSGGIIDRQTDLRHVSFGGVSFSYDGALADDVLAESVPEGELPMPGTGSMAEHAEFSFDEYALPETFHAPRIYVYPVDQLVAGWEPAGTLVAGLQQVLAERPPEPDQVAILPPMNAGQLIRARTGYVDFQGGSGVRFLTMLGQAYLPVHNFELFYTFQGLTDDGRYYVAAILPIAHPSLPADGSHYPGGDADAFVQQYESYAAQIESQLEEQDPTTFTPSFAVLDAMIQSLTVEAAP